jgi:hypothetical protein
MLSDINLERLSAPALPNDGPTFASTSEVLKLLLVSFCC